MAFLRSYATVVAPVERLPITLVKAAVAVVTTAVAVSSSSRSGTDGSLVTIQHVTGVLRVKKRTAN